MRTTLVIDDDLLEAAKSLAEQKKISLGKAVSELMRKGMQRATSTVRAGKGSFPVFSPPKNARILTLESVKRAEEDDEISSRR